MIEEDTSIHIFQKTFPPQSHQVFAIEDQDEYLHLLKEENGLYYLLDDDSKVPKNPHFVSQINDTHQYTPPSWDPWIHPEDGLIGRLQFHWNEKTYQRLTELSDDYIPPFCYQNVHGAKMWGMPYFLNTHFLWVCIKDSSKGHSISIYTGRILKN